MSGCTQRWICAWSARPANRNAPSGVDLAKLKYEVTSAYHDVHGTPWRDRGFARIHELSRWGSRVAPLVNALNRVAPLRAVLERSLQIDRRRPLPELAAEPFERWWKRHRPSRPDAARGEAIYFNDTFTNYYQPEVGKASVGLLGALGYRVRVVAKLGCCGRPAISKGQLGLARSWVRSNIALLAWYAEQGVPIVGSEPSCLLTLRDEYPELVPGRDADAVAAQAVLLDELVVRLAEDDPGWLHSSATTWRRRFCCTRTAIRRRWWGPSRRWGRCSSCPAIARG